MSGSRPAPAGATVTDGEAAQRILAGARHGRRDLASHLVAHGLIPIPQRHDAHWSTALFEAVHASGLTGRGGGGFPTARKWEAVVARRGRPGVVVNALEGEPASRKDRALLELAPHLVLDGAELVAAAVSSREITVCVADDRADSAAHVRTALAERAAAGLVFTPAKVVQPPGRYITGEESALAAWLAGGFAHPQFRPTKGVPLIVGRRPVLIHNAETLAHVALVARHGADWFRQVGAPDAPGTCLITASGAVERPGVYEVELGTTIDSILRRAGRQPDVSVLVGGYGGTWVASDQLATPYAPGPLAAVGASVGAGVLAAVAPTACGVAETARVAIYMANESAGQCGPCVFGLHAVAQDLVELARADADRNVLARLRHRLGAVEGRGACRHPDGVVRMVRSALEVFAKDFAEHARRRPCRAWNGAPTLPVPRSAADAVRHGR